VKNGLFANSRCRAADADAKWARWSPKGQK
jgi:hypothetical protein